VIFVTWSKRIRPYVLDIETGGVTVPKIIKSICFAVVVLMLCSIYVLAVADVMTLTAG
jgi:hypothetical protein